MTPRIGSGLDVHPFSDVDRPLVLGGVTIDGARGLAGHSDADVVAHATTDAILGALALGDLGSRFGVDTPELAGADSMRLLSEAVADAHARSYRVGNLDAIVVAQAPRLAPYRDAIRQRLAEALAVGVEDVSVKATTTDRLGAMGREEGIACWATVLLIHHEH